MSCIERCPHFSGKITLREHIWDVAKIQKCPSFRGVLQGSTVFSFFYTAELISILIPYCTQLYPYAPSCVQCSLTLRFSSTLSSQRYPSCLAQALFSAFCQAFPTSTKTFNSEPFLSYLTDLTSEWIAGTTYIPMYYTPIQVYDNQS